MKKGYLYSNICAACGSSFLVDKSRAEGIRKQNHCSMSCAARARFQEKEKHPRWKGGSFNATCLQCSKVSSFPSIHTATRRKFCSIRCYASWKVAHPLSEPEQELRYRNFRRGPDNNKWKGGVSREHEKIRRSAVYKEWRTAVYKRDNWTCQKCNTHCNRGDIVAHHIMLFSTFPSARFIVKNGMTLHRSCHLRLHQFFNKLSYEH